MQEFWKLFRESVILQGVLTIGIWAVILALVIQGREPPEPVVNVGYTIIGFWFGTKVQAAVSASRGK